MGDFKTGAFVLNAGDFRARLRHNPGGKNPTLVCLYRVRSDPSNLPGLSKVCEDVGCGRIYHARRCDEIGWVVDNRADMRTLYSKLVDGATASRQPRAEVLEAWGYCLTLLPTVLRATLAAKGKPYVSKEWAELRAGAITALEKAIRRAPPQFNRLPTNYFELWA